MKRFALVVCAALALSGCGTTSVLQGGSSLTATVSNPITQTRLYELEGGLSIAVRGMLAYKKLCIQRLLPASCGDIVRTMQAYTRQVKPMLVSLRAFVRNNDQINAIVLFTAAQNMIADVRAQAESVGAQSATAK